MIVISLNVRSVKLRERTALTLRVNECTNAQCKMWKFRRYLKTLQF